MWTRYGADTPEGRRAHAGNIDFARRASFFGRLTEISFGQDADERAWKINNKMPSNKNNKVRERERERENASFRNSQTLIAISARFILYFIL
jgi:hypothetical protein